MRLSFNVSGIDYEHIVSEALKQVETFMGDTKDHWGADLELNVSEFAKTYDSVVMWEAHVVADINVEVRDGADEYVTGY